MSDSLLEVVNERCDQCLFTPQRIVSLDRYRDIIETCMKKAHERYFVCHKTERACCRGFYDSRLADRVAIVQVARRLNLVSFVKTPP